MGFTLKSFWSFWQPSPNSLSRLLQLEYVILERRRVYILRKQALLRIKLAATVSAMEQIEQEAREAQHIDKPE